MEKKILEKLHETELEILDEIVKICNENKIVYFLAGGTLLGAVRHKGFIPWDDDIDIMMPRQDYNKFLKICMKKLDERFLLDCNLTNNKYWLNFAKVRLRNTIFEEPVLKNYDGNKGIYVDIFPLDNAKSETSLIQRIQNVLVSNMKVVILAKFNPDVVIIKNKFKSSIIKSFKILPNSWLLSLQQSIMSINKNKKSKYFVSLGSIYDFRKETILKEKFFPIKQLEFEGGFYNVPNDYNYILSRIYGDYMKIPPKSKRITHNPLKIKFEGQEEIIL